MGRAARFWRSREGALVLPALAFYVLVYLYPLSRIVGWSFFDPDFTLKFYRELLAEPAYFKALRNTLEISVLVTLISLMLGYPLAYLMTTTSARARRVLTVLILVPFWTSFIVRTYAWIVLLGTNGVVNGALRATGLVDTPLSLLYSRQTVVLGLVHAMIPFAVVPIYASIERIDEAILEAAATLGARPWSIFAEVIIPISLPGVIAAGILVFIEAMGAFITPQLLGSANDMMIAQLVQERFLASFDWPFGSAVAVIYLVFTGVAFAALIAVRKLVERRVR